MADKQVILYIFADPIVVAVHFSARFLYILVVAPSVILCSCQQRKQQTPVEHFIMPDTAEIPNNTTDTALLNKRIREERFFMDSLEFGLTHIGYHLQVRTVNPNPVIGKYKYYMFPRHDFHGWLYGVDMISPFMPDSKYHTELKDRIDNLNNWIIAQYGAADVRENMPAMETLKPDTAIFFNRWYAGEKRIETGVGKIGGEMYYAVCRLRHRRRWIDFLLSRNVSTVNINLRKLQRNYIPPFDYYYTRSK